MDDSGTTSEGHCAPSGPRECVLQATLQLLSERLRTHTLEHATEMMEEVSFRYNYKQIIFLKLKLTPIQ